MQQLRYRNKNTDNNKKTINCDINYVIQYFLFRLESQLGEKPPVLTSLVSLLKGLSDDLLGLLTLRWLLESLSRDNGLEGLNVQSVSGWKQVVVVDDLDEWLDSSPLGNLLLVVLPSNLQWVSLDTSNQSVWEAVVLGALIVWLHNDHLLTCITSTDNDSYI